MFNKFWIAKGEELKVHDILNRANDTAAADILRCLSITELVLPKSMRVEQMRGKSTRGIYKVHMVIIPDAKTAIQYILK